MRGVLDEVVGGSSSWYRGSLAEGRARMHRLGGIVSGIGMAARKVAYGAGLVAALGTGYLLRDAQLSEPDGSVASLPAVLADSFPLVVVDTVVGDSVLRRSYDSLLCENASLLERQGRLLMGYQSSPSRPVRALDSLLVGPGEYLLEVHKPDQRLRVWQQGYVLVADVPCSTGRNFGEKVRRGDLRTPGGYFTIASVQESRSWMHGGVLAYGDFFARLNYGSWDAAGVYHPAGHCSIGVHATPYVDRLGFEDSEGCVRIYNPVLREFVGRGIIAPGVQGFIVPYSHESLVVSDAGVGRERLRSLSGDSMGRIIKPVRVSAAYESRVVAKGGE